MTPRALLPAVATILILSGCGEEHGHDHAPAAAAPAVAAAPPVSDRIAIPAAIRANLGVTFARAEYRAVASTGRFPGRFEPDAGARVEYAVPIAGHLEVLVRPYQTITAGTPLYRISGRAWAQAQREWREARMGFDPSLVSGRDAAAWRERAELLDRQIAHMAGLAIDDQRLAGLAEAAALTVHARSDGTVEPAIAVSGSFAGSGAAGVSTLDIRRVRLRATALQSDLGRLKDGLPARIVPAVAGHAERIPARMALALEADPAHRTHDLIAWPQVQEGATLPAWARPGVAAMLEVTLAGGDEELAVPVAATIRDGLATLLFRRDPADADQVIRMEADLGVGDGTWVQVLSGLKEGDEVVVDGIYQLKLTGAGKAQPGGHFHPDGSFHPDTDEGGH